MIAHLEGTVLAVSGTSLVVSLGGVGLTVQATPAALADVRPGQPIELFTHLVVREESLTLFGFQTAVERDSFEVLQSVSGVGPRIALALLAVHTPAQLATAVASGDRAALERVPGIGAKVAARLLLELGGRLSLPHEDVARGGADGRGRVVEALEGLGWSAKAARDAVDDATPGPIDAEAVPAVLRAALQTLGGKRG